MKFAILTTTHQRPELLLRAIESVQNQTYADYAHYIVNDSPEYDYSEVEQVIAKDQKIVYIKNTQNSGKNASLNTILTELQKSTFAGYIVYLDDDDWLATDCLSDFESAIKAQPATKWFVSDRAFVSGKSITTNKMGSNTISYFTDYLLFKKFRGDATHCINFPSTAFARFPIHIPNGEEWYYFLWVSKVCQKFVYIQSIGTYTNGYSADGQNAAMQKNYKRNTLLLFRERQTSQTCTYLCVRFVKTLFAK
jgi:glycosyltransferase involved in cell wall biosynthesis